METRKETEKKFMELAEKCGMRGTMDTALNMAIRKASRVEVSDLRACSINAAKDIIRSNAVGAQNCNRVVFLLCTAGALTVDDYTAISNLAKSGSRLFWTAVGMDEKSDGYEVVIFNCWD